VNEPSIEDSVQILQGLAPKYEQYHGVKISEGILRQAVLLSERYITDRFLPDKIDLIDEAYSDLNLKDPDISRRMEIQRELDDYEKERTMLEEQEEKAEGDYARMAELKSKELQLNTELNSLLEKGDPQLSMENLAHVIELWTKIPAAKIREQEFQRLIQLEVRLKSHIIGQDEAVSAVAAAVRRNRVASSPSTSLSASFFAGPRRGQDRAGEAAGNSTSYEHAGCLDSGWICRIHGKRHSVSRIGWPPRPGLRWV